MKRLKLLPLMMIFCTAGYATPFELDAQRLDDISQSQTWHNLLLYKNGKSTITHARFFLSDDDGKNGKIRPKDELIATLMAWQKSDPVVCQFPARLNFLKNNLNINKDLPHCPEFESWYNDINVKQLSLMVADEHPNNLAAGFGHSFVKATKKAGEPIAINYTPNYPSSENAAVGAYRSLMGGYVGVMELLPFEQKVQDYLSKDKRDVWQFELALSQDETDQIVRHIWEVKDMARPYYLTHDNCATEIVRLIEVVRPQAKLLSQLHGIVSPAKIATLIKKQGLVAKTTHLPSTATTAQAKQNNSEQPFTKGNPATATPMHRAGVFYRHNDGNNGDGKDGLGVSVRTAYHDMLDRGQGVREWLDLEILGVELASDDKVRLEHLTVIRQRSYNPANTAKGYDGKASGMALEIERTAQDNSLALTTSLEKGRSWAVGQGQGGSLADGLCYGFGVGHLAVGKSAGVGVGVNVGCAYRLSDNLRAKAEIQLPYWYLDDTAKFLPQASVGVQYDVSQRQAVRATWHKDKYANETKVAYQWYF